jgi:hypothetical protein
MNSDEKKYPDITEKEDDFLRIVENLAYDHAGSYFPVPEDREHADLPGDSREVWSVLFRYWKECGKLDKLLEIYPTLCAEKPHLFGYQGFLGRLWNTSDDLLHEMAEGLRDYNNIPIIRRRNSVQGGDSYRDLKDLTETRRRDALNRFRKAFKKIKK